jgi:solute carrier family 35 (UDP-sugar transporter), member A1/2/3
MHYPPRSSGRQVKGILATLGIANTSGFAIVYTEKFIKGAQQTLSSSSSQTTEKGAGRSKAGQVATSTASAEADDKNSDELSYGLAYTQVQLAVMSILTIGLLYALMMDWQVIVTSSGLFVNFSLGAMASVSMSALGGLIVASMLKYGDSILKGYATALSVILTGVLSIMMLFHTHLSSIYLMGIGHVVAVVILYNAHDLHHYICHACSSCLCLQRKK